MYQVTVIDNNNDQKMKIVLPNGVEFDLVLQYREQQSGWFLFLTYGDFQLNNIRVVTSGNFLHQWRNILPFGMACAVEADQEPLLQDDFYSGRAVLYILERSEVQHYAEVVSGQVST